ncbi:FAD-dependent oxidoreductase [Amycolatopsis acidicola]|uniref:FAD-dependent oxidoreductase n=1 Tax=Amycolatopsis acidicola TaxID=2596893 RepID=A0A5N0VJ71_9PSEU|nr:FAD-dependent oxidoreductase [Amycolatopsis acidicola]KAA9166359.1 FAD-dependent oxidoreductase [Amycolatopsis acidicola]
MRSIVIIGGGIAGAATALAAAKAGLSPVVFEAHPASGEDIGAFLTLAPNGFAALRELGVADAVAAAAFPMTELSVLARTGEVVASRPTSDSFTLRRAELCRVLQTEAIGRGIPLHHGKRLVTVREDEDGVTAEFADGESVRGDLLVGADGLRSAVRGLLDDSVVPRYAGQRVFYGHTAKAAPSEPGRMVMVRGSSVAFGYTVSPARETYWFGRTHGDELSPAEMAAPGWRDHLVELLRDDATPAAEIVAATAEPLLVTNTWDLPAVPRWRTGRVVLVGDAAHAASPATGQGASMAVEDAIVLAKALRDTANPLEVYERLRRPRAEANVAASARMTAGATDTVPRVGSARRPADGAVERMLAWDAVLED